MTRLVDSRSGNQGRVSDPIYQRAVLSRPLGTRWKVIVPEEEREWKVFAKTKKNLKVQRKA